jgi:phenylacetate-coenzyme A ligase PaaK-like adenylate-forming protein
MEAKKEGIKLGETVFWLMGEPLTEKKHQEIEEYGCKAYTLYGCNEIMLIGQACLNPKAVDEIHVCEDKLAVIQHNREIEHSSTRVNAFLFTTLLEISPKIFLNTEIGDYGVIDSRRCGCPFEELGFVKHMHTIRSFEKLTAEGMTFVGSNIVPLVEEIIPMRFGGNATDYQFLEEEDEEGFTRLVALVSPKVGEINEEEFKDTVFKGLFGEVSSDYTGARAMRDIWSKADTIRIRRENPIPTKRGKIMPFYIRTQKPT